MNHGEQTSTAAAASGFGGLRIAAFETRMATETAQLITRHGGRPFVAPALRELPLSDQAAARRFGERLLSGHGPSGIDLVLLMTGSGTTALFDVLKSTYDWSSIHHALQQTALIARGPKPAAALKAAGLHPTLTVPEPNTWVDVLMTLDTYRPVKGLRVAVQEYGTSNPDLLEALTQRGAEAISVPIYRWALPDDLAPLRQAIDAILTEEIALILITNAAQVDHVMQVLEMDGKTAAFRQALKTTVVASIGPSASERLRALDWPVDFEPTRSKLAIFVKELSEAAPPLVGRKRQTSQ